MVDPVCAKTSNYSLLRLFNYNHLLPGLARPSPVLYIINTLRFLVVVWWLVPLHQSAHNFSVHVSVCLCVCPFFIPSPALVRQTKQSVNIPEDKEMWYVCPVEFHLAVESKTVIFRKKCMELENIMLREISQT